MKKLTTIGQRGQVVIPAAMRKQLKLREGQEIVFEQ